MQDRYDCAPPFFLKTGAVNQLHIFKGKQYSLLIFFTFSPLRSLLEPVPQHESEKVDSENLFLSTAWPSSIGFCFSEEARLIW